MGWSGPATLKLVGDKDQTEAIEIEAKLKKNFVYKFTHEDKKIDNITSLYFDFKKKKYNNFIEAIKIESGREVTSHDGDFFAVYEEVVNIQLDSSEFDDLRSDFFGGKGLTHFIVNL